MKKIVFTGGGTAGHITPNLALIEYLNEYKIYYLGSNGMEKDIIKNYPNIEFIEIPSVKLIRSLTPKNLLLPFKLIRSISVTKKILKDINPSLIFSKGGFDVF
jgi:UDP-N-acetylglucosamine--N-acetylmuramyl-(pentapeptide) pyrophosphoryl-undecaprenol N-acetylglucosamine transferase